MKQILSDFVKMIFGIQDDETLAIGEIFFVIAFLVFLCFALGVA
jgi:hypothetical protein